MNCLVKWFWGDEEDTRKAIASAKAAFIHFSKTTKKERIVYLQKMYEAVAFFLCI
jgi:aldehyde dehydrogenase (NAD+)